MMRHPVLITMLASVLAGPALAQAKTPTTAPMLMPQNAAQIELVAVLGRGDIKDVAYSPTGQSMAVAGSAGLAALLRPWPTNTPPTVFGHRVIRSG